MEFFKIISIRGSILSVKPANRSYGRLPQTNPVTATRYPPKSSDNQYFIFDIALGYFSNLETDHSGECPEPNLPRRKPPGNPIFPTESECWNFAEKHKKMAKRYSEEEKQSLLTSYWASGQSCSAYSRVCGISALTLKAWQERYRESNAPGFVAISAPLSGPEYGFRLSIGPAVLDFDRLPPFDWVSGFLKSMAK